MKIQKDIDDFIVDFWQRRDPTPGSNLNAVKKEYFRRMEIADKRFKGISKGSQTDRGRILILYGEPETIDYYNGSDMYLGNSKLYGLELWLYNKTSGRHERLNIFSHIHRGRMKFIFADLHGYGIYDQIYSSEKNESIDSRIYLLNGK